MADIRAKSLSPIIAVIRKFEFVPEDILTPLDIDIHSLTDPKYEEKLDLHKCYALFEAAAEKIQCHYLGALVGNEAQLSLLGPIGLLMEYSPTVETALRVMLENMQMQQNLADCRLEINNTAAMLTFDPYDSSTRDGMRHFVEAGIFTLLRILQFIIGKDFKAKRICFSHAACGDITPYRRLAMSKVKFSEEYNAIVFDKKYLGRQKPQANDEIRQALSNYLKLLQDKSSNDLLTHLDFIIQRGLRNGSCTLQLVAEEIHIHPRNLQRKLKARKTSFSEILAACRSRKAIELLHNPDLQITQIALRLGYSDATVFGQAFKKWFNKMPSEYRKQLNQRC